MKKILLNILLITSLQLTAQIPVDELVNIHDGTTAEMNSLSPDQGALWYNIDDTSLYVFDGTTWLKHKSEGGETKIEGAGINAITGAGTTASPYVVTGTEVDGSITNELTDLNLSSNSLTLSNPATGTNSVDLSGYLDNTDTQDLSISGNTLSLTDGGSVTIPSADGAETKVEGAGINTITGAGTTASPYVVTGTEVDGSITNELQTLSTTGNQLTISNGNSVTIPNTTLTVTKETIGYVFAAAHTESTGTNAYNINSRVTRTNIGRYTVILGAPHPNGAEYDITLGVEESAGTRDGNIIQVITGSQIATGFQIMILTGDNGGTADSFVDEDWSFQVSATKEVVTNVTLN